MLSIPHETLEQIVQRIQVGNTLISASPLIGGASAQVILMDVKQADDEIQKYLLRVHSEVDRDRNPNIANHEFRLLKTLNDSGLPVAQPYYLDESCEIYPLPYLVVGYIEGATEFSPQNLSDFILQSAKLLAKIHQVKQQLPMLGFLSDRNQHVLWWIEYQPDHLDEELDEPRLRDALNSLFPLKQVNESTLLHGDFWPGNLIWSNGQLVGVIDWEDAEIGDPLSDLSIARLDMLWAFGKDAMLDFTQAYQDLMPHLDYGNLAHWDFFTALRPANQLMDWSAGWAKIGRPDVTFTTMKQDHQWFVKQAFDQMK